MSVKGKQTTNNERGVKFTMFTIRTDSTDVSGIIGRLESIGEYFCAACVDSDEQNRAVLNIPNGSLETILRILPPGTACAVSA